MPKMKKIKTWINAKRAKRLRKYRIRKVRAKLRKYNKTLKKWKNNDYHFNIKGEHRIYFHIGSKKHKKTACRNFEEWQRCLLVRHKALLDDKYNQNFLRYINREMSASKTDEQLTASVIVPALFGFLTILTAIYVGSSQISASLMGLLLQENKEEAINALNKLFSDNFNALFYALLIATGIYVFVVTVLICQAKNKSSFFEDVAAAFTKKQK